MRQTPWILPDGIVELTGHAALQLEVGRRRLLDLFASHGYQLVVPPLVEFLENLTAGEGHDLDLQTFKLTDQLSGKALGVRADITPQVARHDAHHHVTDQISRFCYAGSVLHTKPIHILANRSSIQAGAEVYGHQGIGSDREILHLMLASLLTFDPQPNHWLITVGHAQATRQMLEQLELPSASQGAISQALNRHSEPDLIELAAQHQLSARQLDNLLAMSRANGDKSVLQQLQQQHPSLQTYLNQLCELVDQCEQQHPSLRWFFDFASTNHYTYETGIVFYATHTSSAEPIARGGRYDKLSQHFGADRPAVGFSCDLLALCQHDAAIKSAPNRPLRIWAPAQASRDKDTLDQHVTALRQLGHSVTISLTAKHWQALNPNYQRNYDACLQFDQAWSLKLLTEQARQSKLSIVNSNKDT